MFRKLLCAVALLGLSLGLAMADEFKGKITKIDGNKLTIVTKDAKDGKTLDVAANVKVCKMEGKEKKEVAGGLSAIATGKGVGATVITGGDGKITEIILAGKKKK